MTEKARVEELLETIRLAVTGIYTDIDARECIPVEYYKIYLSTMKRYREMGYEINGDTMELEITTYVIELRL